MKKTSKNSVGKIFLLLTLVIMLSSTKLNVFAEGDKEDMTPKKMSELKKDEKDDDDYDPDADPYETGTGVHADPAVFEKDFGLTVGQKIYTITEMEKVVSEIIEPDMSDLEKYYTLAIWVNKRVHYDWEFWSGRYNFEYYSHQWDSYGCMKEDEASVCAGIAVFYAAMCHAADLPCNYVRMDPKELDHTISYIPDINGNSYYLDVTENMLFMSKDANPWGDIVDKDFSRITKEATDNTFNYTVTDGSLYVSTIKDYYDTSFEDWFKIYALHESTNKKFETPYVEKGSGTAGKHIATYHGYASNRTDNTDIWFLDDFYADPAAMKEKILAGKIDESVINVTGLDMSYDCDIEELKEIIGRDIAVDYFPSVEGGNIVAKAASLKKGEDYDVEFTGYDEASKTATFSINGRGDYKGSCTVNVLVKSAVLKKAPIRKTGLVYNDGDQELIEAGEALCGEMQYAFGNEKEPTGEFSADIPTAKDSGEYIVWYKAVGDEIYGSTKPEMVKGKIKIDKISIDIIQDDLEINVGEKTQLNPTTSSEMPATFSFYAYDEYVVVNDNGVITGVAPGEGYVYIYGTLETDDPNYETDIWKDIKVRVYGSIEDVRIRPGVYDKSSGQEPVPEVVYKRETLVEGKDYSLEKVNETDTFDKPGDYEVKLVGMGRFKGEATKIFSIMESKEEAEQAETEQVIEEAKSELAKAQELINNLDGYSSASDIAAALKELVEAQKVLAEAEEVLTKIKETNALKEMQEYEKQVADLKTKVKELEDKLDKAKGTDVVKKNNTLEVKGRTVTLKRKSMKKTQRLKASKVIKFKNKGQGTLTYVKVSGNKKITINKKTGKVTIKKGLKKGTYKVKVKVRAKGNDTYSASSWKVVTFKVKIK